MLFRRHWPTFSIGAAVLAVGLNIAADPVVKPSNPTGPVPANSDTALKDILARQQQSEQQFKQLSRNLLTLAQKLAKSDRIEDQTKAKSLLKAIELADKEGVDNKFAALVRIFSKSENLSINDLNQAAGQNDDLVKVLRDILKLIIEDDSLAALREEQRTLKELLDKVKEIDREIAIIQNRTETGKGDPNNLAKEQRETADKTRDLLGKFDPNAKVGKPGDKNTAGEARNAGKGKENAGEIKDDTNKPKGEARDAKGMGMGMGMGMSGMGMGMGMSGMGMGMG
ncbi:MAG: hypothetical protein N2112_13340, partial [Gemmataceae bacterium]|nr:hypothetical protein [Gemmataceae bacterium]